MTQLDSLCCHKQVGPHALNLAGGQAASARIAKDIIFQHSQSGDGGTGTQTTVERAHTEEYIQQMHGLMWL